MTESFAELLKTNSSQVLKPGAVVQATVVKVSGDYVTVNAGLKSEAFIPLVQFRNEQGQVEIAVGQVVDVALEAIEDGWGETRLSRDKAKRVEAWKRLEVAFEKGEIVRGFVSGRVKGGFTVELDTVRAFLPGSLVGGRPGVRENPALLEGKECEVKIIKFDAKRNNVVVSLRGSDAEGAADKEAVVAALEEGQIIHGMVKNLTNYGAFVDLGGVDGLLHITDMSWRRVKHPSEIVAVGQEVTVKILKLDREKPRVSLGLKQLGHDPWNDIKSRYPAGSVLRGKVTDIRDYGCFVELEEGLEGLVHVSEMDWTNKNVHPSKVVQVGEEVFVKVLDIDEEQRRISLGIKQCRDNPWDAFAANFKKGDMVQGKIKSITDFGLFIGLEGGIDGLVHASDLAWSDNTEEALRQYKKGEDIEAVVLSIDPERERISLGIKQLGEDMTSRHARGSLVVGTVLQVDAKGAVIGLADGVEGYLKVSDLSRDRLEDARQVLKEGDSIEAKVIGTDKKSKQLSLSVKAKETQEEQEALKELRRQSSETTTLGDLFKEQMEKDKE